MVSLPEPGSDWGGFRIDRQIGLGGRGRTFAAFDPGPRRTRALKVLLDVPSDDPAGERFQRQPLTATELGHPNIITAHYASDVDGVAYVVMDLYPGGSLADEIGVSTLRVGRIREVLAQVASALDAAHAADLVHLDVKPSNILCADDGRTVVLSDFGSTRFVDEARQTEPVPPDEVARLPFHEAPEVLLGDPAGAPADVYSMGTVLFFALTGRLPFIGTSPAELTEAHRRRPVPRLTDLRPDLPGEFDDVIAQAMAKEPDDRFASGRAFVVALDDSVKAALERRRAEAQAPVSPPPAAPDLSLDIDTMQTQWKRDPVTPGTEDPFETPATEDASALPPTPPTPRRTTPVRFEPVLPDEAEAYGGRRKADREGGRWRLDDGTIDGAMLDVYEDDPPSRRLAVVIGLLLVIAVSVTGWLVWQAIEADNETVDPTPTTEADP